MSFKKDFPSLNNKVENHKDWIAINKEFMQETCIDKEKVREVILKIWEDAMNKNVYDGDYFTALNKVKEELGLKCSKKSEK